MNRVKKDDWLFQVSERRAKSTNPVKPDAEVISVYFLSLERELEQGLASGTRTATRRKIAP